MVLPVSSVQALLDVQTAAADGPQSGAWACLKHERLLEMCHAEAAGI
jgi:hypothetical protein